MAKKEFTYRGKNLEELKDLSLNEFAKLLPSRQRRSISRGISDSKKMLIKELEIKETVKTHIRDTIILPQWVGKTLKIYNGKEFIPVIITEEMIGLYTGEMSMTRVSVKHSDPGVGATRSSTAASSRST